AAVDPPCSSGPQRDQLAGGKDCRMGHLAGPRFADHTEVSAGDDIIDLVQDSCESFERAVMMSSDMPSAKYSCSASPLMLANGSTAIDGLSGAAGRAGSFSSDLVSTGAAGFASAGDPTCSEYTRIGSAMFLSWVAPR